MRELGKVDGHIRTIARNSEQYISVEKSVCINKEQKVDKNGQPKLDKNNNPIVIKDTWYLRLIDTLGFLQSSLENLVKSFPKEEFRALRSEFDTDEKFELMTRKGVFPYDWFDGIKKLDEPQLPSRDAFYSAFNNEECSEEGYAHAKKV